MSRFGEGTRLLDPPTGVVMPVDDVETSHDKPEAAHIVLGRDGESGPALATRARIEGFPVTALCGYTWVPHRSALGLPVCAECLAIYEYDPNEHNDRDRLPDE